VFEASLADLQNDEDQAHRKIRLRAEDVQGRNALTNFWVMNDLWLVVHYLDTVFSLISQLRTYPINC
jgi:ribosomal protein S3AE